MGLFKNDHIPHPQASPTYTSLHVVFREIAHRLGVHLTLLICVSMHKGLCVCLFVCLCVCVCVCVCDQKKTSVYTLTDQMSL